MSLIERQAFGAKPTPIDRSALFGAVERAVNLSPNGETMTVVEPLRAPDGRPILHPSDTGAVDRIAQWLVQVDPYLFTEENLDTIERYTAYARKMIVDGRLDIAEMDAPTLMFLVEAALKRRRPGAPPVIGRQLVEMIQAA